MGCTDALPAVKLPHASPPAHRRRDYAEELVKAFPDGTINLDGSVVDLPLPLPSGRTTILRVSLTSSFPQVRPPAARPLSPAHTAPWPRRCSPTPSHARRRTLEQLSCSMCRAGAAGSVRDGAAAAPRGRLGRAGARAARGAVGRLGLALVTQPSRTRGGRARGLHIAHRCSLNSLWRTRRQVWFWCSHEPLWSLVPIARGCLAM
jgi:hypothetical protein